MDEKGLGRHLQAARRRVGLTQQGLCQKADLSYSTLAKIERGAIKSPSIFTIQKIAAALNVSLDELIGVSSSTDVFQVHSKSGVRFVYFDVNGCLVRSYHRAFARLALDSGQTPDTVETAFWHYNDHVCLGEMNLSNFNKALAKELQMKEVDWFKYYLNEVEPMPNMGELVMWVSQHYRVGLLTNIMPGFLKELLKREIIPNIDYTAIIDSSVIHSIKPEAKIYQVALEQSSSQPNEILFIDDSRTNLMAAEKLDWRVLWFDEARPEESSERIRQTLEPFNSSPTTATNSSVSPFVGAQNAYAPVQ